MTFTGCDGMDRTKGKHRRSLCGEPTLSLPADTDCRNDPGVIGWPLSRGGPILRMNANALHRLRSKLAAIKHLVKSIGTAAQGMVCHGDGIAKIRVIAIRIPRLSAVRLIPRIVEARSNQSIVGG